MYNSQLNRKINRRKLLINFLLLFLSPTNIIMVTLSKNLDKFVYEYQKGIYTRYTDSQSMIGYAELLA